MKLEPDLGDCYAITRKRIVSIQAYYVCWNPSRFLSVHKSCIKFRSCIIWPTEIDHCMIARLTAADCTLSRVDSVQNDRQPGIAWHNGIKRFRPNSHWILLYNLHFICNCTCILYNKDIQVTWRRRCLERITDDRLLVCGQRHNNRKDNNNIFKQIK